MAVIIALLVEAFKRFLCFVLIKFNWEKTRSVVALLCGKAKSDLTNLTNLSNIMSFKPFLSLNTADQKFSKSRDLGITL